MRTNREKKKTRNTKRSEMVKGNQKPIEGPTTTAMSLNIPRLPPRSRSIHAQQAAGNSHSGECRTIDGHSRGPGYYALRLSGARC